MRLLCGWSIVVLAGMGVAQQAAGPALELVGIVVVRARACGSHEGTPAKGELPCSRMTLRLQVSGFEGGLDAAALRPRVRGSYANAEGEVRLLPQAEGEEAVVRVHQGASRRIVEVDCVEPPREASQILDLEVALEVPGDSERVGFVLENLREHQGEKLTVEGQREPWYQVEHFGPRQLMLRRMSEDAPPLEELTFTNQRGDALERNTMASAGIRDPATGHWVANVIFVDYVPLVVNLVGTVERKGSLELRAEREEVPLP